MKTFNVFRSMKSSLLIVIASISLFTNDAFANDDKPLSDEAIKAEVKQFFDTYLDTYNQRFGKPEKAETFIQSLSSLIHQPFLMSPPTSSPFEPQDITQLTQVFDGFLQSLEKKGAVKLAWKSVNLQVLSPQKVLANNIGYATDANGKVMYETISIYLLYREQSAWKIALFSPYELDRNVILKP